MPLISNAQCSLVIFFQIFHDCHVHIWSIKCQFCQNYTILWAKKVNKMPFFPIFHEKINALMPMFYPKSFIL